MDQESPEQKAAAVTSEVLKQLAPITSKQVEDLTESDIAVLRARRSYLTEEQCAIFAAVLADGAGTTTVPDSAPSDEASEAAAPAGGKRKK